MRLINTSTLEFEEHNVTEPSSYAILSHRWGENEISYSDYLQKDLHVGPGFEKIKAFCRVAKEDHYEWAWIDTCCIDKKSSAELSEAITSMYNWYGWAEVCYVYLVDVPSALEASAESRMKAFRESQWWRRGWTLQELLAPTDVEFYDCVWGKLATKEDLCDTIADITGVASTYLTQSTQIQKASVATRMSWASRRETTRSEDIAYCLMGIFDVNMPLLYGEGDSKAFLRLQQEIIKTTHDDSIFAWQDKGLRRVSMLATWPGAFKKSRNILKIKNLQEPLWKQKPFSVTNMGLKIRFPSCPAEQEHEGHRYVLLHCCAAEHCERCRHPDAGGEPGLPNSPEAHQWLAVELKPHVNNRWMRCDASKLFVVDPRLFKVDKEAFYVL